MLKTYKRKDTYNQWTEDAMKNVVNSVMGGNDNIRAASGLFRFPNTTLKECIADVYKQ
jgi:hypothetical protein